MARGETRRTTSRAPSDWVIPQAPPPELDDVLDAASRCFERFGVRRTSVQDVAREMGVDRTTVYRRVGNIDQISRLLALRELHRFLGLVTNLAAGRPRSPAAVVDAMAAVVEGIRAHPVAAKLLTDERDLVGFEFVRFIEPFVTGVSMMLAPMLDTAMRDGYLARRNPRVVAEWLVRMALSLVLVEQRGDLRAMLGQLLVPALQPEPRPESRPRSKRSSASTPRPRSRRSAASGSGASARRRGSG